MKNKTRLLIPTLILATSMAHAYDDSAISTSDDRTPTKASSSNRTSEQEHWRNPDGTYERYYDPSKKTSRAEMEKTIKKSTNINENHTDSGPTY